MNSYILNWYSTLDCVQGKSSQLPPLFPCISGSLSDSWRASMSHCHLSRSHHIIMRIPFIHVSCSLYIYFFSIPNKRTFSHPHLPPSRCTLLSFLSLCWGLPPFLSHSCMFWKKKLSSLYQLHIYSMIKAPSWHHTGTPRANFWTAIQDCSILVDHCYAMRRAVHFCRSRTLQYSTSKNIDNSRVLSFLKTFGTFDVFFSLTQLCNIYSPF